ncbi:hypothetical protein C8T65DRAFT_739099 [Cerioporus squamosus]|nr:hypothetical protein C8T65DRAFT_739099 [Cerioporus squamosus]
MTQTTPQSMDPALGLRPEEGLRLLLIGAVWSSFLIPVVILLFYFSDSPVRRRPIFLFNILSIILGLVEGAVIIHTFSNFILDPERRIPSTLLTVLSSIIYLIPSCVQLILIFRVVSEYSARLLSVRTMVALCSPIVAMKCARVAIASVLLAHLYSGLGGPPDSDSATADAGWKPDMTYVQVLWLLQLFDDIYISAILAIPVPSSLSKPSAISRWSPRKLMRIALTTCAIPVILDIIQVAQSFLHLRFAAAMDIPLVNSYVQIICVLLATLWDGTDEKSPNSAARHDREAAPGLMASHNPTFREQRFEQLASPSIKDAFSGSVRDSSTAVGEEDAEDRLKWLAELGQERIQGRTPPSLCTAATFDNTGQPVSLFYAV